MNEVFGRLAVAASVAVAACGSGERRVHPPHV
jgi:hypothetical protein